LARTVAFFGFLNVISGIVSGFGYSPTFVVIAMGFIGMAGARFYNRFLLALYLILALVVSAWYIYLIVVFLRYFGFFLGAILNVSVSCLSNRCFLSSGSPLQLLD